MDNQILNGFEKQWDKFIVKFKGKLLGEAKKQKLSHPLVCILLRDIKLCWESEYDECGRWLKDYKKINPEKADQIHNILDSLTLSEVEPPKEIPDLVEYAVPLAGAAVGLGVSSMLGAQLIVKTVSTVVPALLLYSSIKTVKSNKKSNGDSLLINKYIEQLDTYKERIMLIVKE